MKVQAKLQVRAKVQINYYAYGLKIAAISSRKFGDIAEGSLKNNYLYQGAFSELDDDIGWHDFPLRNYDAQIGRFVQQDPYQQFASPYLGMGDDPINIIDPSGGVGIHCPGTSGLTIFLDNVAYAVSSFVIKNASFLNTTSIVIRAANTAAFAIKAIETGNMINNSISAVQVGGVQQENVGWQDVSILLAESPRNGAGSGPDWVKNPDPKGIENVDNLAKKPDDELFGDMRYTIRTYTQGVLQDVGDKMVEHFRSNTGKDFYNEILNNHISASSQFQNKLESAMKSIKTEIQRVNGDFSKYKKQNMGLPSFPKWEISNPLSPNSLYTLIGGTQYGRITLVKYKYDARTKSFTGIINVTIMDDFGVSASDVKKAEDIWFSKGIRAMWYLQHIRGFKPYRTVFNRQFEISF